MMKYGWFITLLLSLMAFIACKTLNSTSSEIQNTNSIALCAKPVDIHPYLVPSLSCVNESLYSSTAEAIKRRLTNWIPCNNVERIDDSVDLFGPDSDDSPASLSRSTYMQIFRDWLGASSRFNSNLVTQVFANLDQPWTAEKGNPILTSAMAQRTKALIRGAKHNVFFDMFLLGGSWGADIMRDLAEAAHRGVQVILLHDNVNKFAVAAEMDPLWEAAIQFSLVTPNFVVIASNIHPPARVSGLPFGLDQITTFIDDEFDFKTSVSIQGRSDHSKVLIVDALFDQSLDEYRTLRPQALITSHNHVDSAASFYHDEAVVISGPAAVVALVDYQSDLSWALQQATQETPELLSSDNLAALKRVIAKLQLVRSRSTLVAPGGNLPVQPLQISANDEVRNLDASVMAKIASATATIDIYNRIAYNWPLAIALKAAIARGVRVRIILDQMSKSSSLGNATLPYMIMQAPLTTADGTVTTDVVDERGNVLQETDLEVHWFLPFRPAILFNDPARPNLEQEIHAKTIIIDGHLTLFGSANLDQMTWAGGFREYSIWVDDASIAAQTSAVFERLWNHPYLNVSHSVWMGAEEPSAEVVSTLAASQQQMACNSQNEFCDYRNILQGGSRYNQFAPLRETMRKIMKDDAARINLVTPAMLLNQQGRCQIVH